MTVSTTTRKKIYSGDASTTVFGWDFKLLDEAELVVYIDGNAIAQGDATYPWSVSGIPGNSGDVTFSLNPPPVGTSNVLLVREMIFNQETDYTPYDSFPAETHEAALDKATMQIQEVNEETGRAIKTAINDETGADYTLPAPEADKVLAVWNGTASALEIGPTVDEVSNAQGYAVAAASSASDAATSAGNAATSAGEAETANLQLQGYGVLSSGASLAVPLNTNQTLKLPLSHNIVTFVTASRAAGLSCTLIIEAQTTTRTLVYNPSWIQIGVLPTSIPAGKTLLLSFVCTGTAETDVIVVGGIQL